MLDVQLRQPEPVGLKEVWRAQDEGDRARCGWGCRRCGGGAGRLELCRVCQVELRQLQHVQEVRALLATEGEDRATGDGGTVGGGRFIGAGQAGGVDEVTVPSGHSTDGFSGQATSEEPSIPSGRQQGQQEQVPESRPCEAGMQVSESQAGADCAEGAEGGEAQESQERTDEGQWEDCRGETQKQEPNSYESSMVGSATIDSRPSGAPAACMYSLAFCTK